MDHLSGRRKGVSGSLLSQRQTDLSFLLLQLATVFKV